MAAATAAALATSAAAASSLSHLLDDHDPILVFSQAWKGYVRAKLPDGTFRPERYVFGKGGKWAGAMRDATMDKLSFGDVARILAKPLAEQSYLPATDAKKTDLLIMVYWGTTIGPADNPGMFGRSKALAYKQNVLNAEMLGVDPRILNPDNWTIAEELRIPGAQARDGVSKLSDPNWLYYRDLKSEIAHNRYFVVLMAYDFPLMWKQRKHRLLWLTRFSILERRHDFTQDLPQIADFASPYFGQDSQGLVVRTQTAHVILGPLKVIDAPSSQK